MNPDILNDRNIPVLHPDYDSLLEEEKRLRSELTVLLLQKDDLQTVQNKRIESAYLRRFGALELKLYEAYCACLRQKRKAALIRASVNRREPVDEPAVEATLDRDLASYRETLQEKMDQMSRILARGSNGPQLTAAGREELKKLYRAAVKALHPDLHPEASEREQKLLQRAVEAYRFGDLKGLRAVCEAADPGPEDQAESSLEVLRAEVIRLRKTVRSLAAELEELKKEYPYTLRCFLEDPQQGEARKAALEEKLQALRARKEAYEAGIRQMLATEDPE